MKSAGRKEEMKTERQDLGEVLVELVEKWRAEARKLLQGNSYDKHDAEAIARCADELNRLVVLWEASR